MINAPFLTICLDETRISTRAIGLLPEEMAAGVTPDGAIVLARIVLEDSELRTVLPTPSESRRSEDAVAPWGA